MIKVFGPKENNFTSNGIVTFKPFKLIETKKISLNGWHIDVDAPLEYEEYLKQDMLCVVKVKSRLKPQAFRIKNTKKTQGKISFEAEHVMFDARNYFLLDARPTNMSAIGALRYTNERTDIKSPFSFSSDVNNSATAYFIRKNLLEALTVIEERWGGYYEADNWHISLKRELGQDRGEVVSYGKNLESIQVTEDWSNVVTKLYPVGFDGLLLPEKYLESEIKYDQPYTKTIQFETKYEDEDRTVENLLPELIANAKAYLEQNQYPMVNYEVKSNINEFMEIGDTIHVKHPLVDIKTEVQEYTYDILSKRTTSLVFGNYSRDVKKKFESIRNDLETLKGNKSELEAIIGNQTDLINSLNKNGHVVIDDNQILILDKLPKANAKYVWRWNMGGLAFSENGYEGPFKQAWTIDGVFNTDFIAAGTIMTNHLHSDVGSSLDISSNKSITMVVNQLENLNSESNLIPNLTASVGAMLWKFKGGKRILTKDNYLFKGGTLNTTFIPKAIKGSLSQWGKSFYTSGSAISPKAYVVPGYDYSYRSKRFTGSQSLEIVLHEFSYLEQETAFKKTSLFKGNDKVIEVTTQLDSRTNFIALEFITGSDVTINNRLEIADDMFNRGNPKSWELSANEAKMYSEAQFDILDDSIKSTVDDIKVVEGKVEKNESQINQMSDEIELKVEKDGVIGAIIVSSEGLKIPSGKLEFDNAVGKNVNLSGKLTTNELTATGGTIGNFDIRNGTLETKEIVVTKKFTQADMERLQNIILEKITATEQDWIDYDLNGDGVLNISDMVLIQRALIGKDGTKNPMTIEKTLSLGKSKNALVTELKDLDTGVIYGGASLSSSTVRSQTGVFDRAYIIGARDGNGLRNVAFEIEIDYSNPIRNGFALYATPQGRVKV